MATKQEEIREGMEAIIQKFEDDSPEAGYGYEKREMVAELRNFLHSKGVVIKVERELPVQPSLHSGCESFDHHFDRERAQRHMIEAGYVAVEPLIKEETEGTTLSRKGYGLEKG